MQQLVDALGGFVTRADLCGQGIKDRQLSEAVRSGAVRRLRRGQYTTLPDSDPRVAAVRLGGRLTSVSVLSRLGAWLWQKPALHISVPRNARRPRGLPNGAVVYWDGPEVVERGTVAEADQRDALTRAIRDLPFDEAVAVFDWALQSRKFPREHVIEVISLLPSCRSRIVEWVDPNAESLIESIVRTRLRQLGYRLQAQVPLANGQFIDLVLEGFLAIEVDGRRFHEDRFEADRSKDLVITTEGRHVLRLTYSHVRHEWPRVVDAVAAAVDQHRARSEADSARHVVRVLSRPITARWWIANPIRLPKGSAGIQREEDTLRAL
ncbi:hypothetical protein GCM10025780_06000 [Frondihabitans cladoniiphilus]|uniref:Very-short-patch-repair endonuclease n=1 Tax=Frondihabitans cladoniiphilus TaxID=715785 RepID=A0ABP8VM35_9MICO